MEREEWGTGERPGDDEAYDQDRDGFRAPPGESGGAGFGGSDFASLPGDPGPGERGRVRLRCPEPGCDQTGTAADYRKAYWPRCERHLIRMVLEAS